MSYTQGPFTLTGAQQNIPKPSGMTDGWVEILNESAYTLQVGPGGAASNITVPAWFEDFIVLNSTITAITINQLELNASTVAAAPSSVFFLNWLDSSEGPPVRAPLVRSVTSQSFSIQNGFMPVPKNTTLTSQSWTIPDGTAAVAVAIAPINNDTDELTNLVVEYAPLAAQQVNVIIPTLPIVGPTTLYGVLPTTSLSGVLEIAAASPNTNAGTIFVMPIFLPPGVVNVASIINTPNDPVIVEVTNASPTVPLSVASAPFTWSKTGQFNNAVATLSFTPPAGMAAIVTYASLEINQSGAVAFSTDLELSGSVLGQVWSGKISVPATNGAVDRNDLTGIAYAFGVNEVVTLKTAIALGATIFGDINLGGYTIT